MTTIAQMTDTETVMNLLRQVPLFANLKDEDKVCIEETEEWRLSEGELLVKAGEAAGNFFVLLEGEISVSKRLGDQEIVVARYRPGAFFGEVPLLLGVPIANSRTFVSPRIFRANPVTCAAIRANSLRYGSTCSITQRMR